MVSKTKNQANHSGVIKIEKTFDTTRNNWIESSVGGDFLSYEDLDPDPLRSLGANWFNALDNPSLLLRKGDMLRIHQVKGWKKVRDKSIFGIDLAPKEITSRFCSLSSYLIFVDNEEYMSFEINILVERDTPAGYLMFYMYNVVNTLLNEHGVCVGEYFIADLIVELDGSVYSVELDT